MIERAGPAAAFLIRGRTSLHARPQNPETRGIVAPGEAGLTRMQLLWDEFRRRIFIASRRPMLWWHGFWFRAPASRFRLLPSRVGRCGSDRAADCGTAGYLGDIVLAIPRRTAATGGPGPAPSHRVGADRPLGLVLAVTIAEFAGCNSSLQSRQRGRPSARRMLP